MSMSPEEKQQIWQRGQNALERILKYVSVEKIEKLASMVEDKEVRESFTFKQFIKSLK